MNFGAVLGNDPHTTARETRLLEERGFNSVWLSSVPTIGWGDPYVCMAQAAAAATRVTVGSSVVPAGLRALPEVVSAHATINHIAPGRVILGYGSGSLSRAIVGLPPLKVADLREELSVIRALLDGREAIYHGQRIRLHTWPRSSISLTDPPVELYVAVGGPRTAALAGEFGDGMLVSGQTRPAQLQSFQHAAVAGAHAAGRSVESLPMAVEVGPLCIVRPREKIDSDRIVATVQPAISGHFGFYAISGIAPEGIRAPEARDAYGRYLAWVNGHYGTNPDDRLLGLCERYMGRNTAHDQFISADVIHAYTLVGPMEEVVERLRAIEQAGANEVFVLRGLDEPYHDDEALRDILAVMDRIG